MCLKLNKMLPLPHELGPNCSNESLNRVLFFSSFSSHSLEYFFLVEVHSLISSVSTFNMRPNVKMNQSARK